MKQSFLSNVVGRNTYDEFKGYAKRIIVIGTCVLVVILLLSLFFHWGFISSLLNLVTGTSLLFIAYVAALVLALDVEVEVDEPERDYWSEPEKKMKPTTYRLTVVWGIVLILFGIGAIYFSNKYRKNYAFECQTFLVDENRGIYHLEDGNDDEDMEYTTEMKGYELKDYNYTFCESCREWVEEMESDYAAERYYRR